MFRRPCGGRSGGITATEGKDPGRTFLLPLIFLSRCFAVRHRPDAYPMLTIYHTASHFVQKKKKKQPSPSRHRG